MPITNAPVMYDTTAAKLQYSDNGTQTDVPLTATNITGLLVAGSGCSVTGSGTSGSPYNISASGGSFSGQILTQTYFNYHNATSVNVSAYDGMNAQLNGGICPLPTLSSPLRPTNSGLSSNTLCFNYGYDNSGALGSEWATTHHGQDNATGLEVKNGDASRILLGVAKTNSSGQFEDSATNRGVLSWPAHNREPLPLWVSLPNNVNITNTGNWEDVTGLFVKGLTWGYGYHVTAKGRYGHTVAGNEVMFAIKTTNTWWDSENSQWVTDTKIHDMGHSETVTSTNTGQSWSAHAYQFFLEGEYTVQVVAKVEQGGAGSSGTLTVANYANADGKRSGLGVYASWG